MGFPDPERYQYRSSCCGYCGVQTAAMVQVYRDTVPPDGIVHYRCDPPCEERIEHVRRTAAYEKNKAARKAGTR